eukprot:2157354-Rhodomonas_salina.4
MHPSVNFLTRFFVYPLSLCPGQSAGPTDVSTFSFCWVRGQGMFPRSPPVGQRSGGMSWRQEKRGGRGTRAVARLPCIK